MRTVARYDIRISEVAKSVNKHDAEARDGAPFLILGPSSPLAWRRSAEKLASYFRREFHFDFLPYTSGEHKNYKACLKDRVLLFPYHSLGMGGIAFIGAVGVRWVEWADMPASWSIEWAWFHPYERRKGHLTRAWPIILQMFPDPWVTHPLSKAMVGFLRKMNHTRPVETPPGVEGQVREL